MRMFKNMILSSLIISLLILPISASADNIYPVISKEDFDPLVDIEVTVEIIKIRAFDKVEKQFNILPYNLGIINKREYVDKDSDPDFFFTLFSCK